MSEGVFMSERIKDIILFVIFGTIYVLIEIAWRGYSHPSMWFVGGLVGLFASIQNRQTEWQVPLWKQILRVDLFVLACEFIFGFILNILLGLNVWNYSDMPCNIMGQVCLPFAIIWLPLCAVAIILDDYLEYWFFKGDKPTYKFF